MDNKSVKFILKEVDLPTAWLNIATDLPFPLGPPLHPATLQPLTTADLAPLFPQALIEQRRLEKALRTRERIYYKYEGVSPAGSHKPNTAVAHPKTSAGRSVLASSPDSPGSLGIAISEAVEDAATHSDTNYSLGSVLNHVILHQTIIGLEAQAQMAQAGDSPDAAGRLEDYEYSRAEVERALDELPAIQGREQQA